MIKGLINFIIIAGFCLLSSCTIHPVYPTSGQQIQTTIEDSILINRGRYHHPRVIVPVKWHGTVPDKVNHALLPPLSHYINPIKHENPRFDVAANNIPAREFFVGLAQDTPYNIIVSPKITGTITLDLKSVTLHEALEAVRDVYGYEFHRTSYGYEIVLADLETRMFHINYLDVQRKGTSFMQLTTGQVSNKVGTINAGSANYFNSVVPQGGGSDTNQGQGTISTVETRSEMNFWKELEQTITSMLGTEPGHSVSINSQSGVLIVKAFPKELHRIARYLHSMQRNLNRQVILEAKVLEVRLDKNYQAGIDWGILSNPAMIDPATGLQSTQAGIGQFANQTFPDTDLTSFNGIFTLRINGKFSVIINLLSTQGNVQVLSSPHISTVNNQKAVIKVGQDEFFVTGVSTTNSVVGTTTLPSQDVSLTPFFSGFTLDVTPEISDENTVILHIHPSVSTVTQQTKNIGLGTTVTGQNNTLSLPLAFSTIRESDNIVRAQNGQVVVIGGLMTNVMTETLAQTPGLSDLPFVGTLFRRTGQRAVKSELVILLRPIVVNNKNIIAKLEEERVNTQILQRPYHVGGYPLVFGNEAERSCND